MRKNKSTYTIPYISGDGIGPEVWQSTEQILNAAIYKCYNTSKKIHWVKALAGKEAFDQTKSWLPESTIALIKTHKLAIKGPLATPVGKGIRSINVQLRKTFDLYACIRPIDWFEGIPSPVIAPQDVSMTIFRENTEDIYTGIEWPMNSKQNKSLIKYLQTEMGVKQIRFPKSSALSIKPISKEGSERIIEAAFQYAKHHKKPTITLVHKGNIMKYTEGSFRDWAYAYLEKKYPRQVFTWQKYEKIKSNYNEKKAKEALKKAKKSKKIIINDCIADAFFQNALLSPKSYSVVVTTNLNGDYISDALAAQVGGIGISPGANINFETNTAIFEATHGTAPTIANKNKANPCALILSGTMLLNHIGWTEAATLILTTLKQTFKNKIYTPDFTVKTGKTLGTTQFTSYLLKKLK